MKMKRMKKVREGKDVRQEGRDSRGKERWEE